MASANLKFLPILVDTNAIVENLAFLNLGISAEDINRPKPDRVQLIYRTFCLEVLEVEETSMNQLPHTADGFDPDLHSRSSLLAILLGVMQSFVSDFTDGQYSFTVCDLVNPEAKQTRRVLSLLADFSRFYRVAKDVFVKTNDDFDSKRAGLERMINEISSAERRKEELIVQQEARKRREHALSSEHSEKEGQLSALVNEYTGLKNKKNEAEARHAQTLKDIERARDAVCVLKAQSERLSGEILASPERVQQESRLCKEQIAEVTAERNQLKESLNKLRHGADVCAKAEATIAFLAEQIKALQGQQTEMEAASVECTNAERVLKESLRQLQLLKDTKEENERNDVEAMKVHKATHMDQVQRTSELLARVKQLESEITDLESTKPKVNLDTQKKRNELNELRTRKRESMRESKETMTRLVEKCRVAGRTYEKRKEDHTKRVDLFRQAVERLRHSLTCPIEELHSGAAELNVSRLSISMDR